MDDLSKKFAVVREYKDEYIGTDDYSDITKSFEIVKYYEENQKLQALLLLGLLSDDIKSHFREIHLNWFSNVPGSRYWLPK